TRVSPLIVQVASDEVLDKAYDWLCKARKNSDANNPVWHLRFHWQERKFAIQYQLLCGEYRFSPCKAVKVDGHSLGVWNAEDALVQKALTLVLSEHLAPFISKDCYHFAGHGGTKAAVRKAQACSGDYAYVLKSDVKSYYATVNHTVLLQQLAHRVADNEALNLIVQFLDHLDDVNGELFFNEKGITKGSSLSPLLGALYLSELDTLLEAHAKKHDLFYARFMDDWILMCKTRRQLRCGVKIMNQVLNRVGMVKAHDKTFIGKLSKGVEFLGYFFKGGTTQLAAQGLKVAQKTWVNHWHKLTRLYEQKASREALRGYVQKWLVWVRSGVELGGDWDCFSEPGADACSLKYGVVT
ncbi:reverse transcriptase/maturase family protein, partial [Teredinibacter franksiae]|uniref:reverse transcriptase/maturase family protein n=1 Tax=Teredinibacter franksiae TaxID=2761453 RepID=UPI001627DDAF